MRSFSPPPLPIVEALPALRSALAGSGCAVLQAPPGAGKTTVVPLAASVGYRVRRLTPVGTELLSALWLRFPLVEASKAHGPGANGYGTTANRQNLKCGAPSSSYESTTT
ncbi:MAG: hypothetical protein IT359_13675 [Gemmatimonadaceae bacterium]|nr:hypothetical protein [Gemmatimonadaceae bacterium]